MKFKLPRRRWLLLIACLAAVAIGVIGWCLRSDPVAQLMRERYERIRMGMAKGEVTKIMRGATELAPGDIFGPDYQVKAYQSDGSDGPQQNVGWGNSDVQIQVGYRDDKVRHKTMADRIPSWKIKLRKWLQQKTAGGH